jgi:hypothetical protein
VTTWKQQIQIHEKSIILNNKKITRVFKRKHTWVNDHKVHLKVS